MIDTAGTKSRIEGLSDTLLCDSVRSVRLHCPYCHSQDIARDAFAHWDIGAQAWVLGGTYDDMGCNDCGKEFDEAREEPADADELVQATTPADLLRELIEQFPQFDAPDGENRELNVSGADAVDWLGEFRERAKRVLA